MRPDAFYRQAPNCATCHSGEDFTADRFKSIGLFNGRELYDSGRFKITGDSAHLGQFQSAWLRNVAGDGAVYAQRMFKDTARSGAVL